MNFTWQNKGEELKEPEIKRTSNDLVNFTPSLNGMNLNEYYKQQKTASHKYIRAETMLNMVPEPEVMQITNRELKDIIKVLKDDKTNKTHLVFYFASPLKPPPASKSKRELPLLNFQNEFRGIEKALEHTKK